MKTILFILLSVLVLTSCGNDNNRKTSNDQTSTIVKEVINSYNYDKVMDGELDTITLVKVDSTITIKKYPIIQSFDTTNVKVIGHKDVNLITVTVKQEISGYFKESYILIFHMNGKKPLIVAFTSDKYVINKSIYEFKLNGKTKK